MTRRELLKQVRDLYPLNHVERYSPGTLYFGKTLLALIHQGDEYTLVGGIVSHNGKFQFIPSETTPIEMKPVQNRYAGLVNNVKDDR